MALLGLHGILFDQWTKRFEGAVAGDGDAASPQSIPVSTRTPAYLLSAIAILVVLIVYVMVTKVTVF